MSFRNDIGLDQQFHRVNLLVCYLIYKTRSNTFIKLNYLKNSNDAQLYDYDLKKPMVNVWSLAEN